MDKKEQQDQLGLMDSLESQEPRGQLEMWVPKEHQEKQELQELLELLEDVVMMGWRVCQEAKVQQDLSDHPDQGVLTVIQDSQAILEMQELKVNKEQEEHQE